MAAGQAALAGARVTIFEKMAKARAKNMHYRQGAL